MPGDDGGTNLARWRVPADSVRTQLWPPSAGAIALAVGVGVLLPELDARLVDQLPTWVARYLFSGGPEAARAVLAAVAGSLITVTSLTFSLTVVTLQLASSQYSPRLLRTFTRDAVVQATLAVLLATFTYTLTVLRTVRTQHDDRTAFVPQLSVTLAYLLALLAVVMVAVFLAHLARQIRVESIVRDVHAQGAATMRQVLPPRSADGDATPPMPAPAPGLAVPLCATRSGFLTSIDAGRLVKAAAEVDAMIRVDRLPGDSVIAGTPIATGWPAGGRRLDGPALDRLTEQVGKAVHTGFERTSTQDVAFGLRQLVDVAAKALSPGINDPTTAVHALSHISALMCTAAHRELGPRLLRDDAGRPRVVLGQPDFAALLDLAVAQPRRYGSGDPQVLARLLAMLREVAWLVRDDTARHAAVRQQLERVCDTVAEQPFDSAERRLLDQQARLVEQALAGRWPVQAPGVDGG